MTAGFVERLVVGSGAWVVTAPYRQPRSIDALAPWGDFHLKRQGALWTACGVPANDWHVFWTHTFKPEIPEACLECWVVVKPAVSQGIGHE
ncbi:hypothetical protein BJ958_000886 [Nocardioides kongjuensis]|uniref:Uncharacterized protein n=1 Tax=Nocardioides kongjuensis TaxID=349522 RepID=A0A852RKG1_9ACTN|nr:hypothetical protein [Nocardioides kongjuensis]